MSVLELADVALIQTDCNLGKTFAAANCLNGNPEGFSEIHLLTHKRHDKALLRAKELYAIAIFSGFLLELVVNAFKQTQRTHKGASIFG